MAFYIKTDDGGPSYFIEYQPYIGSGWGEKAPATTYSSLAEAQAVIDEELVKERFRMNTTDLIHPVEVDDPTMFGRLNPQAVEED